MVMFSKRGDFTDSETESVENVDEEVVHPLSPTWALWLWVGDRNLEWGQCLQKQCEIKTIEDFCALRCRIVPPSRLPSHQVSYYVFKSGIKPMWEDDFNRGGGSIDINFGLQYQHSRLDRYWFELLIAGFGGQFNEYNDKICGFTCRCRQRGYAISIWVTDVSSAKIYCPIIEIVEAKLGINNNAAVNIAVNKHPMPSQFSRPTPVNGTTAGNGDGK